MAQSPSLGIADLNISPSNLPAFREVPPDAIIEPKAVQSIGSVEEPETTVFTPQTEQVKPHQPSPPKSTKQKTSEGVMSATDLMEEKYAILDLGPYRKYFGSVSNNFDAMFHGQPGAGKTFFLLRFANWLADNVGKTLYISSEEFGSMTLQNNVRNSIGTPSPNLDFSRKLEGVNLNDYKAVFMDSVNHVGLDIISYKAFREKYPDQIFVLILQKTKSGQFKGGKDWEHEVDIAGEFQFNKAEKERVLDITSKNRFGTLGEHRIG